MKKVLNDEVIKLVSVNIELTKHLDLVREFLQKEKPDVVCLQEVYESDLKDFAKQLGMLEVFAQMSLIGYGEYTKSPLFPYGVGILSALPIQGVWKTYYSGSEEEAKTREFQGNSSEDPHPLLRIQAQKGGSSFTIATTHFTWTPNGDSSDLQKEHLQSLLVVLQEIPDIIFTGDLNAPRGRAIFDTLAKYYKDNIPEHYTTSIDADIHRNGDKIRGEPLMVDALFTTSHYGCENARLQDGVSDHMAIVAEVYRKKDL